MKKLVLFLCLAAITSSLSANEVKNTRVVIYNNNFGIVQETRGLELKKGTADYYLTDVPQSIEPSSVKAKIDAQILEQNYQYDLVSLSKILQKYIDSEITLIPQDASNTQSVIKGKLLSGNASEIVLQKADGGLAMLSGLDKYQIIVTSLPEGFITKPTLVWKINSKDANKQNIDLTYKTNDIQWNAQYVALLNENDTELEINSWVSLTNNSGKTYKDAVVQLIAGDVNTVNERRNYGMGKRDAGYLAAEMSPNIEVQPFFEYHLYDLKNRTTIANNETKQVALFDASNIKAVKEYIYESSGGMNIEKQNPSVKVSFDNTQKNNLGIAFPAGKFSIYKKGSKGNILAGEDLITHTAKDETIRLTIGKAFDIVIDEAQTDYKQLGKNLSEASSEITIKNRKEEDIEIIVVKNLWGDSDITSSSDKYEKKKANQYEFKIKVKKGETHTLKMTYRIKTNY